MKTASPSVSFPELETRIHKQWEENGTFQKSLELRKNAKPFMFYDGPPFATGTPHYGHLLAGTIKDIIPRYQTMKGCYVERRFGWDTHGLPIEMLVEKDLKLSGRLDILEYGVDKFNEACRAGVFKYVKEWRHVTGRLGRWIDFDNDYKTMDLSFMDSVWWVFKQLWEKGRVYQGVRVVPYSWRLSTPLSNFEAGSNYKDVQDPAVTVRFRLNDKPKRSILAWTTTPWTLPANLALCVGSEIDYVVIKVADEELVLAEARLGTYFPKEDSYEIIEKIKGSALVGLTYMPLFPYFSDEKDNGAFRVLSDDYVSTEDGTGIVHQAPAHGEDDYRIGQANGIDPIDPVDPQGSYLDVITDFADQNVKDADKNIIKHLKDAGLLFKQETLQHTYPFCERSNTPLIYKTINAWYVKVEDIRDQMVANNQAIHWIPEHIKEGRFGNWLENARDWNISRNRFWGNPLPIWLCEECDHVECIGSHKELEEKTGSEVTDLHKHFVDELHWKCEKCGNQMTRTPEVLDCWFESGSMPYAQLHYPFENKDRFEASFPADFIAEGLDQTRGWFYTLMILSTSLFEKAPFQNVIVNGMILAEDGKKMSKSLKNYPDPSKIFDEYGADALRLYMIRSAVVRGESLRFAEGGVKEVVRTVLLPFWNAYSFFTTYANIDDFTPSEDTSHPDNALDRWIISRFQTLLKGIEKEMTEYRLYAVIPNLLNFIEELTNWHVRRSRRRFWSDNEQDKQDGYNTLYFILTGFARALAPFVPFVSEEIYQNLTSDDQDSPESVHLTDYPLVDDTLIDQELEDAMALIQQTVKLGRTLRASQDLKTRQPLQSITVVTKNASHAEVLKTFGHHIREELNVKEVLFSSDEADLVDVSIKPNFPVLGPKFGKEMKECTRLLKELDDAAIEKIEQGGTIDILGRELDQSCLEIVRQSKGDSPIETAGGVTVFYDSEITPELKAEGLAREFVNRVQRMRKEADYEVTDRISVRFETDDELASALLANAEYIKGEVLALDLERGAEELPERFQQNQEIDGSSLDLSISRLPRKNEHSRE